MFRSEWNAAGEKQKDIFVVLSVKVSARENVPHSRSLSCHAAYPVRKDPSLSFRGLPSAGSHFLAQTEDGETKREGEAKAFSSLSLFTPPPMGGKRRKSTYTRKKESQNGGGRMEEWDFRRQRRRSHAFDISGDRKGRVSCRSNVSENQDCRYLTVNSTILQRRE